MNEPTEPLYRVTKETKLGYNDARDTKVTIWEGRGADALFAEYPISGASDPLALQTDLNAGSTTRYAFEVWVEVDAINASKDEATPTSGYWQECADPRSFRS